MKLRWQKWVYGILPLLWACSGGAGPTAALDGGGASAPVGGPVGGGGNFATGPVSLPAPSVFSPNNPVEWVYINCTNVPGPNFECKGSAKSVQSKTEILVKIFAPAAAVPRDSFSLQAGEDGSWQFNRQATAGELLELCPKVDGICSGAKLFKIPPEGVSVSGSAGTMKNLVIDGQGNSWHSRWWPRGGLRGLLASLWVSEARAGDNAGYTTVN